ncbi:MAG: ABC transporter ATP-binding protein [Bacteroidetes bacterium]|nr:ABC transporter ATP-binding protein [Bacteroidota bacterium]MCW5894349.1 ABC transporter ATP-binding protein [Bacteroidota bacterium]
MEALLSVDHLTVTTPEKGEVRTVVDDVSFSLRNGQVLAIVGESGSGKTSICRALTRLNPSSYTTTGIVRFDSKDLLTCNDEMLQDIRRHRIRYIFQEPHQALNPALTIRSQLLLSSGRKSPATGDLHNLLAAVGLRHTQEVLNSYPHKLSIGMAQRVMIAMAVLPQPSLLVADEPTSALDASQRYKLLDLLKSIHTQHGMAMIIVTHDLELARLYADDIAVLRNGQIIEYKTTASFFRSPKANYSKLLIDAMSMTDRGRPRMVKGKGDDATA